jgi:hypothetical protein
MSQIGRLQSERWQIIHTLVRAHEQSPDFYLGRVGAALTALADAHQARRTTLIELYRSDPYAGNCEAEGGAAEQLPALGERIEWIPEDGPPPDVPDSGVAYPIGHQPRELEYLDHEGEY